MQGFGTCYWWGSICEIDLQNDPNNCGWCWNSCPTGTACVNGACNYVYQPLQCSWPQADCDLLPWTGCEVTLIYDDNNCGMCGHACGPNSYCFGGAPELVSGVCECNSGSHPSLPRPAHCVMAMHVVMEAHCRVLDLLHVQGACLD